jgi:hypothetical protein
MKDFLKSVPTWAWIVIGVVGIFVVLPATVRGVSQVIPVQPDWEDAKTSLNTPVNRETGLLIHELDETGVVLFGIEVKYRLPNDGFVPLYSDRYFERDVSGRKANDIRVAGYDKDNHYFVVCFGKPFGRGCYHYCRFPESKWEYYKKQNNQDQFYEQTIKGRFDCREAGGKFVPVY